MTDYTCALCGKPTEGESRINDNYYCHSQDGTTCYMKANWTPTFEGRADGCYIPKRALERLGLLELATATKDREAESNSCTRWDEDPAQALNALQADRSQDSD